MILDTITKVLRVVLGEAHTTNPCQIVTAWAETSSAVFIGGNTNINSNGTTPVVVVAAPSNNGVIRDVHEVRVFNNDTVSHKVILQLFDGSTAWIVGPENTIAAGETAVYTPSTGASGPVGPPGVNGQWTGGTVTAIGAEFVISSGTLHNQPSSVTLAATAAATLTIAPALGVTDVLITMPATGGTVTLAAAPSVSLQRSVLHFTQGATAGVIDLNTGYVFATSGGPTSFTLTPSATAKDLAGVISNDGTHWLIDSVLNGVSF